MSKGKSGRVPPGNKAGTPGKGGKKKAKGTWAKKPGAAAIKPTVKPKGMKVQAAMKRNKTKGKQP